VAGYGIVRLRGSKIEHIDHGTFEAKVSLPLHERLHVIGRQFEELLETIDANVVALEKAFLGANVKSAFALGESRGVFTYLAGRKGLEIIEMSPTEIKKGITGSGRADKEHLRALTLGMLGIRSDKKLDATDALAMALFGAQRYSLKEKFGAQANFI